MFCFWVCGIVYGIVGGCFLCGFVSILVVVSGGGGVMFIDI